MHAENASKQSSLDASWFSQAVPDGYRQLEEKDQEYALKAGYPRRAQRHKRVISSLTIGGI
jgi:hypothetical protein